MPPKSSTQAKSPEPVKPEEDGVVEEDQVGEQLEGDFIFPDGCDYVGQYYRKGKRVVFHGQGRLQSGSDLFEGSFEHGLYRHGRYVSGRGAVYEGYFRQGLFHGPGEYTWPNDVRKYRGMWKDGAMHGPGEFENFSIGVDKIFKGYCVNGQFNSSLERQEEAKQAFLAAYSKEYVTSATAWLRCQAEKATPPEEDPKAKGKKGAEEPEFPAEVLREVLVPSDAADTTDLEATVVAAMTAERAAAEQHVAGPYPGAASLKTNAFIAFAGSFADGAEAPGAAAVMENKEATPLGARLTRDQLQHIGQVVKLTAPTGAEAGAIQEMVLLNIAQEYDASGARWKLVHLEEVATE